MTVEQIKNLKVGCKLLVNGNIVCVNKTLLSSLQNPEIVVVCINDVQVRVDEISWPAWDKKHGKSVDLPNVEELDEVSQEMLSKITKEDREKISIIFKNHTHWGKLTDKTLCKGIVEKYLVDWANAKKEFYKKFGNKFVITEEVPDENLERNINEILESVKKDFPVYRSVLDLFGVQDYLENKLPDLKEVNSQFDKLYNKGMKLSKFLSKLFQDPKFDIELSKVLQIRGRVNNLDLTIHPVDLLMNSINGKNFGSCYSSLTGMEEYSRCGLGIMMDKYTMVAYTRKPTTINISIGGTDIKHTSFFSRNFVFVVNEGDKIGYKILRSPIGNSDTICETIKKMLINTFDFPKILNNSFNITEQPTRFEHFGTEYSFVAKSNFNSKISVAKYIYDLKTGEVTGKKDVA